MRVMLILALISSAQVLAPSAAACSVAKYSNLYDRFSDVLRTVERADWIGVAIIDNNAETRVDSIETVEALHEEAYVYSGPADWVISHKIEESDASLVHVKTRMTTAEVFLGTQMKHFSVSTLAFSSPQPNESFRSGWGDYPTGSHGNFSDCSVAPYFEVGEHYLIIKRKDGLIGFRDFEPVHNNNLWVESVRVAANLKAAK